MLRNTSPRMAFATLAFALGLALFAAPVLAGEGDHDAEERLEHARHLRLAALDAGVPCDELNDGDPPFAVRTVRRGWLGVELTRLTPELRRHFGAPEGEGVMIGRVMPESPAFRGGLRVGDILTRVDDDAVRDSGDLSAAVRGRGGEPVDLQVWRDGSVQALRVTLDEKETCTVDLAAMGIDLDKLVHDLPDMSELDALRISEEAMAGVRESLEAIDWAEHAERLQEIESERLEERMEEVQERLELLQERLEAEYERYGEEMERALEARERALEEAHRLSEKDHQALVERAEAMRVEAERKLDRKRVELEREHRRLEVEARAEAERAMAEAKRAEAEARAKAEAGEGGGPI